MELPKFLLGDNSNFPEDIFVIHTDFPRFIINLRNDEIELLEELDDPAEEEEWTTQVAVYIEEASAFYDAEMEKYVE